MWALGYKQFPRYTEETKTLRLNSYTHPAAAYYKEVTQRNVTVTHHQFNGIWHQ